MSATASPASDFTEKQLALIRRTFYAGQDKEFFQDKARILRTIATPAKHLKVRFGVKAPAPVYTKALKTVIETVVARGMSRAKIERFSVYFLHCVQAHLKHHGEEYYEEAKASLGAVEQLPDIMRQLRRGEVNRTAEVLIEVERTLKSRAGRKKKSVAKSQLELI